ncbi:MULTISPECIES: hypothetical protein [Nocardia]|uniref:hypothetical protein n=1 Tax=Nocardia TaxID=1817 RepID=UPI000FD88ED9|nr:MULTISPECIES: hypothetical protein [Nocardia]MBF6189157.1 hypothetical protein [Nocardia farcinica]MBF6246353.1 hypothetical protein [Nocardia elegans]MBF6314982.1 hypothetical protein [Nocardia farcinica]MBF6411144.1 hypothetical protein [Nocardia farcinica]UEX26293.1 hypothetical protein LMJ57_30560 [Nocardia farcinica]
MSDNDRTPAPSGDPEPSDASPANPHGRWRQRLRRAGRVVITTGTFIERIETVVRLIDLLSGLLS